MVVTIRYQPTDEERLSALALLTIEDGTCTADLLGNFSYEVRQTLYQLLREELIGISNNCLYVTTEGKECLRLNSIKQIKEDLMKGFLGSIVEQIVEMCTDHELHLANGGAFNVSADMSKDDITKEGLDEFIDDYIQECFCCDDDAENSVCLYREIEMLIQKGLLNTERRFSDCDDLYGFKTSFTEKGFELVKEQILIKLEKKEV